VSNFLISENFSGRSNAVSGRQFGIRVSTDATNKKKRFIMPTYTQNGNGELPSYVKEMLANWPTSGSGNRSVHRHILAVANRLRHYVELEHAASLIRSSMPRAPKGREIEETLKRA
jgi:hypothetical protein